KSGLSWNRFRIYAALVGLAVSAMLFMRLSKETGEANVPRPDWSSLAAQRAATRQRDTVLLLSRAPRRARSSLRCHLTSCPAATESPAKYSPLSSLELRRWHRLRTWFHELDPVVGLWISRRWPRDQHHAFGGNAMFAQPTRDPLAPVVRFLHKIDRMDAVRKGETLAHGGIAVWRDDPDWRFEAGDGARRSPAARGHGERLARHG